MAGPGILAVPNETMSQSSRKTRDGRTITYKLTVLQHPERARACGSGVKSSTDRRPVDPPPILELKIYEGEGNENELKDITFSMNANYLLFISLEQARALAHGRTQQGDKNPTVLNTAGQPVAGCAYLDRPNPAGYFLFPDLSIRHEGQYRLSFSLYEDLKEPQDDDPEEHGAPKPVGPHFTHRLDVRSVPFTVYSAKKFPGLAESTELSRIVAEQGCRVRIRRDVRMRRRNDKPPTKDWDHYEDDTAETRGRLSATPEATGYHTSLPYMEPVARPPSSGTMHHPSLAPSPSRRTSFQDAPPALQPAYGVPTPTPQPLYPQSYGNAPSTHPGFTQQQAYPPSAQQPQPVYHPGHQLPAAPQQSPYHYGPPPPISASQHVSPPAFESGAYSHRPSIDYSSPVSATHRRASGAYGPVVQSPPTYSSYPPAPAYPAPYNTTHSHHPSFSSADGYSRPAPAEPIQPAIRTTGVSTPLPSRPFEDKRLPLPPLTINTGYNATSATLKHIEPSSPATLQQHQTSYPQNTALSTSAASDNNKRAYSQVFNERHLAGPLRQGARPTPTMYTGTGSTFGSFTQADEDPVADVDGEVAPSPIKMSYRRANGSMVNRNLPPHD